MLLSNVLQVLFLCLILCSCCVLCGPPLIENKIISERDLKLKKFPPPTIDIVISIDKALLNKLQPRFGSSTKRKLRKFMKKSIAEVQEKFKQPNMFLKVQLNILAIRFLKNNPKAFKMNANATAYLRDYCMWQSEKKKKRRYFSILITGLNIYVGSKITARSYMNGICHPEKSCALLEWHPFTMVYLLSHEIAHSMGIAHDGRPYNACNPVDHIMASKYNPHWQPNTWSVCSKYDILNAFKKHTTKCLFSKGKKEE